VTSAATDLLGVLGDYQPRSAGEAADLERLRRIAVSGDPWTRAAPLHATGSAVVVHPPSRRVLLRWHARMQSWLQVGGHADPGETHPYDVALREAREETGLADLVPWPDAAQPAVVQVAVVPVPAGTGEPAHEHADVRYLLATSRPEAIVAEDDGARLAWLALPEALDRVAEDNLRECLQRIGALFDALA
jgi:8-oxo-dGTP pyrophosphatase MutT (NUDIX family)